MADLLHSKLFFNSPRSPSFCFLLSRAPHPSFCISRFAPVRRSRVSCSSPVLANLSPHSTRLHIISTAEQSDGSVVFKFGDASENSQSFENVNGSGSQSEVLGVLDYEHGVNHTKPELIGTLGSEYEVKFERESVSDAVLTEIAENGGTGVLSPNDSSKDENCSIKVEGSAQSNVDEDDAIKVENFTERKMEHQETVLESVAQEGELVGLCDSPTDLQSNGDSVEDEQDHNLISTVEIENSGNSEIAKHDLEANNLAAISDCTVGSVLEGASDSELVKQDIGIEVLVTPSNSNLDLITEKFVETGEGKLMAAVSASQLELKSIELQEVSGNSSSVESLERAASLEDSEICRHMKHAANNDMLEIADTNSPVEASDTIESLENKELESNVNHVANEEHGDMFMLEASDIARSLKEDEHDGDVKRVLNEEDGDDKLEAAGRNSAIEPLDIAVSLDDDERDNGGGQFTSKEHGDNYMLRTARNLPTEASDIAVSSEDDEHDRDLKQVANGEDDDDDALETAKTNSTIEASDIAVSLEDDEDDNDIKQMANDEVDDQNKLQQITAVNLVFGASDIAVSFTDDELDSNATQAAKEEDSDGKTWKMAAVDSLVQASDMAVCLGDSEVDINEKHTLNEDDVWAGLIEKPAPLEPEPILREEAICNSQDDFVASESTSGPKLVDEAAHPIISLSNDVLFGGNSSEAAPAEASGLSLAEDNVDSRKYGVNCAENATSVIHLSSAAASLPHPGEASTGGEDTFFICQNWFGVADGVAQWSFGGADRGKYAQELMRNCERLALNSQSAGLTDIKEVLQQIAVTTESSGSARVLIAHFANQAFHVANIGDTGFVIIRNGAVFKKSSPMVHEFNFPYAIGSGIDPLEAVEEYHFELQDGDVIIAATDGLFDNLYEQEIASLVSKSVNAGMEPKELAELLVTKAQEVGSLANGRSPFADAAQAAGHTGVVGGKLDHVTVIVSLVQNR